MNILRNKQDRNGIKWALKNWKAAPDTCTDIIGGQMNGYRTTHPQGSTYLRETNDPDQLAHMLEFETNRCGLSAKQFKDRHDVYRDFGHKYFLSMFAEKDHIDFTLTEGDTSESADWTMSNAREILAKLLLLPNESADDARKVLWGIK